jgi:sugar lactone lactonase YvrE
VLTAAEPPVQTLASAIARVGTQRDILGECPLWDERTNGLWWIDIRAPALRHWQSDTSELRTWPMPELIGSIALADDGRLLVALSTRLALFDLASGAFETLAEPNFANPDHRFNDGRCDRQGRFWVGSMNNLTRAPEGCLYRFDLKRGLIEAMRGICIPNSLAFSPDGATMFFADSLRHAIESFDYDVSSGRPGAARPFATIVSPAFPDGSCIDAEGGLWNAEFHGGRLVRYLPDGRVDRVVALPVQRPTCCTFGGPGLGTLYVTTTSQKMSQAELAAEPLAGALLALDVGLRGLPEPRFKTP